MQDFLLIPLAVYNIPRNEKSGELVQILGSTSVGHAPELASGRSDIEEKVFAVEMLLRRGGGFQIADPS